VPFVNEFICNNIITGLKGALLAAADAAPDSFNNLTQNQSQVWRLCTCSCASLSKVVLLSLLGEELASGETGRLFNAASHSAKNATSIRLDSIDDMLARLSGYEDSPLSIWLRCLLWAPILQRASTSASQSDITLMSKRFPVIVRIWWSTVTTLHLAPSLAAEIRYADVCEALVNLVMKFSGPSYMQSIAGNNYMQYLVRCLKDSLIEPGFISEASTAQQSLSIIFQVARRMSNYAFEIASDICYLSEIRKENAVFVSYIER
jgi:hypothetical protein